MKEFVPSFAAPASRSGPAWWFAFRGRELLVQETDGTPVVPCVGDLKEFGLEPLSEHYLGDWDGWPCFAVELAPESPPPKGMSFVGLRLLLGCLEEGLYWVAGRAIQILEWDQTHRFCGQCGGPLAAKQDERAKECRPCGLIRFPRLSPAVLVLVNRGDELLLARQPHFAPGYYSIIAGFVEPGETLEQAAAREVREEAGIEIRDIRYFGSQPWPFPHNLMAGFTAEYAGGSIALDGREIEDARWFHAGDLPHLPPRPTLSRRMIDWFLGTHGQEEGR